MALLRYFKSTVSLPTARETALGNTVKQSANAAVLYTQSESSTARAMGLGNNVKQSANAAILYTRSESSTAAEKA